MNPARLRRGAVLSLFSATAGFVAVIVYDTVAYGSDGEAGISVVLTEMALFAAIVFAGVVAATHVSVRHVRRIVRQGAVAVPLNWAAAVVPAALAFSPFLGGLGRAVDLVLAAGPFLLPGQLAAVAVTVIVNARSRAAAPGRDGDGGYGV
ncbi:hypothetical protein [Actinomadura livida]|uniref:Uncharacterized protein n=1 Tax=Actinomadura livida TaxID=79909 RepID=A0A7W7MVF0_9ACTN|nr:MULTISPECIES: hypothetical protein [Actinomadura]MBB4772493.1 hypothetical protein [Actinomadura catellatispora]GGU22600.1 hypothetical protein GCM10010208_54380 [Actinomadura livida]